MSGTEGLEKLEEQVNRPLGDGVPAEQIWTCFFPSFDIYWEMISFILFYLGKCPEIFINGNCCGLLVSLMSIIDSSYQIYPNITIWLKTKRKIHAECLDVRRHHLELARWHDRVPTWCTWSQQNNMPKRGKVEEHVLLGAVPLIRATDNHSCRDHIPTWG